MTWTIAPAPVDGAEAAAVLRAYLEDIVSRYHERPATAEEVDKALGESPSEDLAPPSGVFLLARRDDATAGCVGVRLLAPKLAEMKRVWVDPNARGSGLASLLITTAERAALDLGATTMRLDTRSDLIEARRLYARHGYAEIPPYHDDVYAEHFFEKHLG